jgi:hypothetical protein
VLVQLGHHLGSTNLVLMINVQETLSIRRMRFSRIYLSTNARIFNITKSIVLYKTTSTLATYHLTHHTKWCCNIGNRLSPVYYLRKNSRIVSFYTLFKRWLLLSLLPICLWIITIFIALSLYFGTLITVLILFFSK